MTIVFFVGVFAGLMCGVAIGYFVLGGAAARTGRDPEAELRELREAVREYADAAHKPDFAESQRWWDKVAALVGWSEGTCDR